MALLALGVLVLSQLDQGSPAVSGGFLLLGAGFGTVMVTATAVLVHQVPLEHAGVAGGLQQTAMNTGPMLGVALATMLMTLIAPTAAAEGPSVGGPHRTPEAFTAAMSTTLLVLASLAALGVLAVGALPCRTKAAGAPQRPTAGAGRAG